MTSMLESNEQGKSRAHMGFFRGPHLARVVGVSALALVLAGCVSEPILTYDSVAPAQILTPVRAAGLADGRARFRELFCGRFDAIGPPKDGRPTCHDYLHRLADEPATTKQPAHPPVSLASVRFIVVPGFMNDAAPGGMRTLGPSIDRLAGMGYRIEYLPVSGGGGAEYNAEEIAAYFRGRNFPEQEKLVVVGVSKGTIDLLRFLVGNPDSARHVDAMVSYGGAVNGSPLAEVLPGSLIDVAMVLSGSDAGDGDGYRALKPSVQMPWLASHRLPAHIKYFSLASYTYRDNVSALLKDGYDRLSAINAKNDGQLIYYDQILPGSTLLGYCNADHWALAMPFTEKAGGFAATLATRNVFPRDAMLEAVLLFVRESL